MPITIDCVLATWPNHPKRIDYFRRTLAALHANLTASRHDLRYVVSSESEHDPACTWHGHELLAICQQHGMPLVWHEGPASLGAGMNAALKASTADVLFLVQDDYELLMPLDLSDGIDAMAVHPEVDLIRYSYYLHPTDGTQFTDKTLGGFRTVNMAGTWPYGDDPHMRTARTVERHGWYTENIGHAAEGDMLFRLVRNNAVILAADDCYFGHFGEVASIPQNQETRKRAIGR